MLHISGIETECFLSYRGVTRRGDHSYGTFWRGIPRLA